VRLVSERVFPEVKWRWTIFSKIFPYLLSIFLSIQKAGPGKKRNFPACCRGKQKLSKKETKIYQDSLVTF